MLLILGTAVLELLICCSAVFAQESGEIYQVDILHDEQGWHIEPCPLLGCSGDTWRIRNFASDTICVHILIIVDQKNPLFYTLAPTDSTDHPIGQWDGGIAVFLGVCPGSDFLTMCELPPYGPALTQWGIIALVVSLITVTVWILLKRKKPLA